MLARRSIQQLVNNSGAYLTPAQMEKLVARLNRNKPDAIEAEWELIVLASLARIGAVEHEPNLRGSARLDVRFRSAALRFVADVTAVSDETYHRENPINELASELLKVEGGLRKQGIEGSFNFRVGGIEACVRKRVYKTSLILPQVYQFKSIIFDTGFHKFIAAIRQQPSKVHYHVVNKKEVSMSIVYSPGGFGMRYSYPPYTFPHDATHNVVHNALKHKAHQIKRARQPEPGELAGVFLCDGGCAMLRTHGGIGTVSLDQVIHTFLRNHLTVDFICVVDVSRRVSVGTSTNRLEFATRVWSMRQPPVTQMLENMFNLALHTLPPPQRSAINTLNHFKWLAGSSQRLYAAYKRNTVMKTNSVEISLRAAIDYLAGRIGRTEFERTVPIECLEQIRRRLEQGKGVTEVSMTAYSGEDDDGLVITFGGPDPAASPFQVPKTAAIDPSAEL